jgi:hypothetical protein
MAVAIQTMTDEQRKSVALEYLKAFDHGGSPAPAATSSTCSLTTRSKAGHLATEARIAPHEPADLFEIHQAALGSRRDH